MIIIRKIKWLFWLSVLCFTANAATFLFMPAAAASAKPDDRTSLIITGLAFWLSLLAGILLIVLANVRRKTFVRTRLDGDYRMKKRIGALSFFSNIPATVADVLLIVSAAVMVVIAISGQTNVTFTFTALSVLVLSLDMHCLFNGRIYKATKYKRVRR